MLGEILTLCLFSVVCACNCLQSDGSLSFACVCLSFGEGHLTIFWGSFLKCRPTFQCACWGTTGTWGSTGSFCLVTCGTSLTIWTGKGVAPCSADRAAGFHCTLSSSMGNCCCCVSNLQHLRRMLPGYSQNILFLCQPGKIFHLRGLRGSLSNIIRYYWSIDSTFQCGFMFLRQFFIFSVFMTVMHTAVVSVSGLDHFFTDIPLYVTQLRLMHSADA